MHDLNDVEAVFAETLPNDKVASQRFLIARVLGNEYNAAFESHDKELVAEIALLAESLGSRFYTDLSADWHVSHRNVWKSVALGNQPHEEDMNTLIKKAEELQAW